MRFRVRPAVPASDYPQIARLALLAGAEAVTGGSNFQQEQGLLAGYIVRRAVAEDERQTIQGYSLTLREPWRAPGLFDLRVVVAPEQRRQGIGSALYAEALRFALQQQATTIASYVHDRDAGSLAFATQRGFNISQHYFSMVLQLKAFDARRFAGQVEALEAAGLRFFTLAQVGSGPQTQQRLYELHRRLALESDGEQGFPSFAEYRQDFLGADWFRADGLFLVADGEQWVGLSGLAYNRQSRSMEHVFTGVDPAYRGRGLAQALKLKCLALARRLGALQISTGTAAANAPMLAINRKLGYRQKPGIYQLELRLD